MYCWTCCNFQVCWPKFILPQLPFLIFLCLDYRSLYVQDTKELYCVFVDGGSQIGNCFIIRGANGGRILSVKESYWWKNPNRGIQIGKCCISQGASALGQEEELFWWKNPSVGRILLVDKSNS